MCAMMVSSRRRGLVLVGIWAVISSLKVRNYLRVAVIVPARLLEDKGKNVGFLHLHER